MPEHMDITDPEIHEPKGISTATSGYTYVADGAGGGAWEKIRGFGNYQDSRDTVGAPAQVITNGDANKQLLLCDGVKATIERLSSDATQPYFDVVTNKHQPVSSFDTYHVRVTFFVENYAGTDPFLLFELDIGGTVGVIFSETKPLIKGGAQQGVTFSFPVFTGSTYLANGGEFYVTYDGTGSVDLYGTVIQIERMSRDA